MIITLTLLMSWLNANKFSLRCCYAVCHSMTVFHTTQLVYKRSAAKNPTNSFISIKICCFYEVDSLQMISKHEICSTILLLFQKHTKLYEVLRGNGGQIVPKMLAIRRKTRYKFWFYPVGSDCSDLKRAKSVELSLSLSLVRNQNKFFGCPK